MQSLRQNRAGYIVSFVFQSLFFLGGLFSLALYAADGDEGFLILGLLVQFGMGVTQVVAGIVGAACLGRYSNKFKGMYLAYGVLVIGYLGTGFYLDLFDVMRNDADVLFVSSAWLIAIYFYVITIMQAFKKSTPPALPHIDMPGYYEMVGR